MKKILFLIFLILLLAVLIVWGVHITKLQLNFIEDCKEEALSMGLDYEVGFLSSPISNVNGRCWAVNKTIVNIKEKQQ